MIYGVVTVIATSEAEYAAAAAAGQPGGREWDLVSSTSGPS